MITMAAAYHFDADGVPGSEIAQKIGRSQTTTKKYIKVAKEALG